MKRSDQIQYRQKNKNFKYFILALSFSADSGNVILFCLWKYVGSGF